MELSVRVLARFAEGLGLRATARVFEVAPNTVLHWFVEAADHLQAFSRYFLCEVQVRQIQVDEIYADSLEVFAHLPSAGYSSTLCCWLARYHLWRFKNRFIRRALDNNPLLTLATIGRAAGYLARLHIMGWQTDILTTSDA